MFRSSITLILFSIIMFSCNSEEQIDPCTQFDQLDSRMLEVIDQVKKKNSGDKAFLDDFKMEQIYWIQYRDRRLRAMYPRSWDNFYRKRFGRKVFNTCKCQEMVRTAEIRLEELEMYLEGSPDNQRDCPSMLNNP